MRLNDDHWSGKFGRVLGDELRAERKRRGWIRQELVDHLGNGLSPQALATYELGTRHISVLRLIEITNALGVSPTDLLQRTQARVFHNSDHQATWTVDLLAASKITDPQLAPLRNWATSQLRTSDDPPKTIQLTQPALNPLAELCHLDPHDLVRRLPKPDPATAARGG